MRMRRPMPHHYYLALIVIFVGAVVPSAVVCAQSTDTIVDQAEERIAQHRMADVSIEVRDAYGQPVPGVTLRLKQVRHAFLFGCNIFKWGKFDNEEEEQAYRRQFDALLNFATLPFYWATYERVQGEPEHSSREEVAKWCLSHDIATKGHPLAWNYAEQRWLPDDPGEVKRLQLERLRECVTRFEGLIDRWDVVNEITHYDRQEFQRRAPKMTAMIEAAGPIAFTRECFRVAREANPDAKLLINDYRTDPAYEKVIEQLVDDDGRPLYDEIGIQSHQHRGPWSVEKIWDVCERFSRFGVPLHFTETTFLSGDQDWERDRSEPWPSTPEGEARQARLAARFYTILFSHPAVEAITWWDFSDQGAWQGAPAGLVRKDLSPKPAYVELTRLIKGKWWTDITAPAGADGKLSVRAFHGDYEITVEKDGEKKTFPVTVGKEGGRFVIRDTAYSNNRWSLPEEK